LISNWASSLPACNAQQRLPPPKILKLADIVYAFLLSATGLTSAAAASTLLGFDPTAAGFDINNLDLPTAIGKRPGTPERSVMPLCYRMV
jgi:hypothetical protein